jgi:AcrR family transcriptional regulator
MPRTQEQFESMRAESQARIVDAALELWARQGYAATSVREIAQHAGIAQGLLYNYFASKEALLQAIFAQSMADVRASFAAAATGPTGGEVARVVRAALAIVQHNMRFWRLCYSLRMQPDALRAVSASLSQWTDEVLTTLEGYFRHSGVADPHAEARVLFALIDGIAQHYVLDPDNYPLDAVLACAVRRWE